MRIEIYIVKTEIDKLEALLKFENNISLEHKKRELIKLFNGLTEIEDLKGYWLNEKGILKLFTFWHTITLNLKDVKLIREKLKRY